ncbi:MAG: nucleotidyl transferase AbiEii/AbiGii toxin family protein [Cyclobacteriaceae bacterium]|nr:MAG: nucleotidyl transferase AbiEii/AbiGii toxin family protein [Cyclobacteriaceae bacterium]
MNQAKSNSLDVIFQVNELAWALYNSNPANEMKTMASKDDVTLLVGNLNKHGVRFILIGGFAMAFHGHVRATNDIDFWIENTPENMDKLRQALLDSGVAEAQIMRNTMQLVGGFTVFNLMETGFQIDLMHNLKAFKEIDFNQCYARVQRANYNGVDISVLNAEDLLKEKRETNRDKDQGDISFLEALIVKLKKLL